MGVLACDRVGCPNIMCGRSHHTYGYICHECYEELVASNRTDITEFMRGPPAADVPKVPIEFYEKTFVERSF